MKYYLELRIHQFIEPNHVDDLIRKPLAAQLADLGKATHAIPEYQSFQSWNNDLLKLDFDGKVLYFKYIKVSISLTQLPGGIERIKAFLTTANLMEFSTLLFADERYNLLDIHKNDSSLGDR